VGEGVGDGPVAVGSGVGVTVRPGLGVAPEVGDPRGRRTTKSPIRAASPTATTIHLWFPCTDPFPSSLDSFLAECASLSPGYPCLRRRGRSFEGAVSGIKNAIKRFDTYQQRHAWLGFPLAVVKKFGDDRAGNLAALIAYYGFFSIFPLLLVLVSLLGFLLRGNPELREAIVGSALAQFPVIGEQIRENVSALRSGVALGVGTATALWAGLGVTQAAQVAMNDIWDVPIKARPNFLENRLRGLILLVVLGTITLASTVLSGLGTVEGTIGILLRVVGFAGALLLNLALFLIAFRVLTDRPLSWGDVLPGAITGAILWTLLQAVGSFYVNHIVKDASEVYGFFGFVLGLLAWIYLGAQITLFAAEINVVRVNRLWPRSLFMKPPLIEADERTLRQAAKVEERIPRENVDVSIQGGTRDGAPGTSTGPTRTAGRRRNRVLAKSLGLGALAGGIIGIVLRLRRKRPQGE
jgi:membrane protein